MAATASFAACASTCRCSATRAAVAPRLLSSRLAVSSGFATRATLSSRGYATFVSSVRPPNDALARPPELATLGGTAASRESPALLPLAELGALVDRLRGDAPPEAIDWMVATLGTLQQEQQDRSSLMKRDWSDTAFEEGEAGNEDTLERFEMDLVSLLRKSKNGLGDGAVLGHAIDLAGAYKKNYKLDKSEAVLLRCTRSAEDRSGAWMVKYLNHISQVRMKQRRNVESLEMMYEMESLAAFPLSEPGASEFYETLYRNMSSCLRSLGREDEAAVYFLKMADAGRHHKAKLDWMDLWDLGILMANRAFQSQRWPDFYKAREILTEALQTQHAVEPHELVLRAKILSNLGQCYLATEEFDQAETYYLEAYDLFSTTVGKRSPLFGMQAWACGNLRQAQGKYREALPYLGEGLYVEVVGDGISVSEISKLLDQILVCLHEWGTLAGQGASLGSEQVGGVSPTEPAERSLTTLAADPRYFQLPETVDLAVMAHKASLVFLVARWRGATAERVAAAYSARSVEILRRHAGQTEAVRWLVQAEAVHRSLFEQRGRD